MICCIPDIDDQTIDLPSSATSGYEFISVNAGKLRNEGIEVLLSGTPIKTSNFEWGVNLNFTKNKNEVISLADANQMLSGIGLKYNEAPYPNATRTGYPVGSFFLYKTPF